MTDLGLLCSASMGGNLALRDLFYRHGDLVYRVFRVDYGLDTPLAGRLLRDTFLEVWRSATSFDGHLSVVGWIVRIALRMGVRGRSAHRTNTPAVVSDIATPVDEVDAPRVEGEVVSLEERLADLPWGVRMATVLVERERMNAEDVADALGVKPRVIWRWLTKALWRIQAGRAGRSAVRPASRVRRVLATGRLCPPAWVLNREACGEIRPRTGWHLSACLDCSRELAELLRTSVRLAALPRPEMGDALKNKIAVTLLTAPIGVGLN